MAIRAAEAALAAVEDRKAVELRAAAPAAAVSAMWDVAVMTLHSAAHRVPLVVPV